MNINKVQSTEPNYKGKIKIIGKISKSQNYLFNLHRENLEQMIKNKSYDMFVKQSKSKRTIMFSTDKNFETYYIVKKNEQDFEKTAKFEIQRKDLALLKVQL